jgi:hypothetical protein
MAHTSSFTSSLGTAFLPKRRGSLGFFMLYFSNEIALERKSTVSMTNMPIPHTRPQAIFWRFILRGTEMSHSFQRENFIEVIRYKLLTMKWVSSFFTCLLRKKPIKKAENATQKILSPTPICCLVVAISLYI